jgi:hypothetical protein
MIVEYGNYRPSKHPVSFSLLNTALVQPPGYRPVLLSQLATNQRLLAHRPDWEITADGSGWPTDLPVPLLAWVYTSY